MGTEDQILLKLIIKGQDPAEIQQLAQSTQGELNARIKTYLDQLVALHKQANDATTKGAKETAQDQIKAMQDQIDVVGKVQRAHEIAANRASNEWRRTAEDLENITTVAEGMFHVMEAGWEHFKHLGEEIVRDTQIYNGLRGSINQMREATKGEIADIDLISAKNRGFQKELQLTDDQYGTVAAAAKRYADVTGTNVKEALDGLIDGMATGRLKMLQHVGVMVDAKKAAEEYAAAHGLIVEKMTDEDKLHATQEAAMAKMIEKTKEFGSEALTVASAIENAFARVRNAITDMAAAIGNIKLRADYSAAAMDELRKKAGLDEEGRASSVSARAFEEDTAGAYGGNRGKILRYRRMLAEQSGVQEQDTRESLAKYGSDYGEGAGDIPSVTMAGNKSKATVKPGKPGPDLYERMNSMRGEDAGELSAPGDIDTAVNKWAGRNAMTGENPDFVDVEAMDKSTAAFVKHKEEIQRIVAEVNTKSGGGFFTQMLFGPDGPEKTYAMMDHFQQSAVDMSGMVAGAGKKMADALGANIAASIAGDKQHAVSARQTTHNILESLAAQAAARAIFETAEGLANLARYGYDAAAENFASAAMFASLATVSGLGARAVGTDAAASSAGTGGGGGSSSGGGFTSGPRSSGGGGTGRAQAPITINVSGVLPGSEATVGREIAKALGAYTRESGSDISDLTTGKAAA